MAKWQFTLELGDFYHLYGVDGDGEITLFELSQKVANKITELIPQLRKLHLTMICNDMADDLENDILPLFEEIAEIEDEDVENFDYAMEQLYDWADTALDDNWGGKKMCWVNTFKVGKNESS